MFYAVGITIQKLFKVTLKQIYLTISLVRYTKDKFNYKIYLKYDFSSHNVSNIVDIVNLKYISRSRIYKQNMDRPYMTIEVTHSPCSNQPRSQTTNSATISQECPRSGQRLPAFPFFLSLVLTNQKKLNMLFKPIT